MVKISELSMSVVIYNNSTGEEIARADDILDNLTDDEVQITASNLAYSLIEDVWGEIDE